MMKSNSILMFILLVMISCTGDKEFNKERWLNNNDVNNTRNPRAHMTKDLLENHLKVGLTRNSVVALLGQPYKDRIENRLPKGIEIPDSLSLTGNVKFKNNNDAIKKYNEFVRLNSKPDTLMLYPVGWSTIDPNFLVVKFDKNGIVRDFWIEQH